MEILDLVKIRLGISSTKRDEYLQVIIKGIISELEDIHGIEINKADANHKMFIVDLACYRYSNRDDSGAMPLHLQFRLRNLYVNGGD